MLLLMFLVSYVVNVCVIVDIFVIFNVIPYTLQLSLRSVNMSYEMSLLHCMWFECFSNPLLNVYNFLN